MNIAVKIEDSEIIELINNDDPSGFKLLYDKYYKWLCGAAYSIIKSSSDVEDVVQEVFMELWKKKDTLKVESSFKYYLRRAVINRSLNLVKKEKRRKYSNLEDYEQFESKSLSIQEKMEQKELGDKIMAAINSLPEKRKEVFYYSRFEDMSYKEIADKMGISVKTVENQISVALKTLRIILK